MENWFDMNFNKQIDFVLKVIKGFKVENLKIPSYFFKKVFMFKYF